MSVRVMALVWDSAVPAPARFTLLALADRADEDGQCWPSIPTLAKKCGTSESTIRRHLGALVSTGYLAVQMRIGASSMYTISVDRLVAEAAANPPQPDTPVNLTAPVNLTPPPRQSDTTPPVNLHENPCQIDTRSISDPPTDPPEIRQEGARGRAAPATRLPDDFTPSPDMITWVRRECVGINARREHDKFVDYWRSAAGANARKKDWVAAWRNWMRRAADQPDSRPIRQAPIPAADARIAALQARKSQQSALPRGAP